MPNSILKFLVLLSSLLLLSCGGHRNMPVNDTGSLASIRAMKAPKNLRRVKKSRKMGRIREMALREVALSLGAQAGLAWRARLIDEDLNRQTRNLDNIYDFNSLILAHNILPPVLLEGRNTLNLADTQTIRVSDRTYKVAKQARFITTPPNWRQYLWMDYTRPDMPNVTLLPRTNEEREVWCTYAERGWKNGVEQANTILEENVARVKEDFGGMILYRKLLAMNMVSPPYVSNIDLGVTGDASEMHIDDRVLRITALPALNINSKEWKAAVAKDESTLAHLSHMEAAAINAKLVISNKTWKPLINPISR